MKTLKIELEDELHAVLAGASRGSGLTMAAIIKRGIGPELRRLARQYNGGERWQPAKPRLGRPPKGGFDGT